MCMVHENEAVAIRGSAVVGRVVQVAEDVSIFSYRWDHLIF